MNPKTIDIEKLWLRLQKTGEDTRLEAKPGNAVTDSVMQTVCAYANTINLNGGFILLGIEEDTEKKNQYRIAGVTNPDKLQSDLVTQNRGRFNREASLSITVGTLENKTVIGVYVAEEEPGNKPLYFKKAGMEKGTYIRKGPTDHLCTAEELARLLQVRTSRPYDETLLPNTSFKDISADAVSLYRTLRKRSTPNAVELTYSDENLLQSIHCLEEKDGVLTPTVAGLLLFGTSEILRKYFSATRFDYIRVSGKEWAAGVAKNYYTIELRESLFTLIPKAEAAVMSGMEKEFSFPAGQLTREETTILPYPAIREVLVNAVMHRDYRAYEPTQVIQYSDRIEIRNPGYSLKPVARFTTPGSKLRNPIIAEVLHETEYAENKGSGIAKITELMQTSHLPEPCFVSSEEENQFTAVLYLHQLIDRETALWLSSFPSEFTAHEALVMVKTKTTGKMTNKDCRKLIGLETAKASLLLTSLRARGCLTVHGKGNATYYTIPAEYLESRSDSSLFDTSLTEPSVSTNPDSSLFDTTLTEPSVSTNPDSSLFDRGNDTEGKRVLLLQTLPEHLQQKILSSGQRLHAADKDALILQICSQIPVSSSELGTLFGKTRQWADKSLKSLLNRNLLTRTPDRKYTADKVLQ